MLIDYIIIRQYNQVKGCKCMLESLLEILKQAEEDVENDRVAPIQNTFDNLRELLTDR